MSHTDSDASSTNTGSTLTKSMSNECTHRADASASLKIVYSPVRTLIGSLAPLSEHVLVVGREVDEGLCVADNALSRTHFRIALDPRSGAHCLGDAGSRNGTRVNGRGADSVVLSPGAVIRAGDTLLVYSVREAMAAARGKVDAFARSDVSVLIVGETGAGKELLARRIHDISGRDGRFVAVNCAALPRDLVAAELFGYRRGAFSGASEAREGLFMHADGGTLLLDEVRDLPLELQPTLLRVLQERALRPLGSDREVAVNVRVLAATLFDLSQEIAVGRFRADLFGRLAETTIHLPPLRERRGEILELASEFALQLGKDLSLTANAAEALLLWQWPYNVRELRSLVRSFVQGSAADRQLDLAYLREERPELTSMFNTDYEREIDANVGPGPGRAKLESLLREHQGNMSAVAQALGKPRAQIYRWLRALGMSPQRFRRS
jgi:transcriptional regulator with GAF, ATPase, and Fis domain